MKDKIFNRCLIALGLVAVGLIATDSRAADIATTPNETGGRIVLTDMPCLDKRLPPSLHVYSYAPNGAQIQGCYYVSATAVHILWTATRDYRIMGLELFTPQRNQL